MEALDKLKERMEGEVWSKWEFLGLFDHLVLGVPTGTREKAYHCHLLLAASLSAFMTGGQVSVTSTPGFKTLLSLAFFKKRTSGDSCPQIMNGLLLPAASFSQASPV